MIYTYYKFKDDFHEKVQLVDASLPVPENAKHQGVYIFYDDLANDLTRRSGDFAIDEDHENIVIAASELSTLLRHTESEYSLDLASVKIYASGGKGFHAIIPMQYFGAIPTPKLPLIYKEFAETLIKETGVTGLDLNLYKMGRGQSLRIAGRKRANGLYKVQITLEELESIKSESDYIALCSQPRQGWDVAEPVETKGLIRAFNDASAMAEFKAKTTPLGITQEELAVLNGALTPCFEQILNYENISKDETKGGFNFVKLSFVRGLLNSGLDPARQDELIKTFAENAQSSRHPTPEAREQEVRAILKGDKEFGCGFMLAVLDKKPCNGCALRKTCETKAKYKKLIDKVSTNKGHINAILSAMQEARGADWDKLSGTLCQCLAKGTPAKHSVEEAVSVAVSAGVDGEQARAVIQAAADERLAKASKQNNITNFEGIRRVDVSELVERKDFEGVADLMLAETDINRYFRSLLGEQEEVEREVWERVWVDDDADKLGWELVNSKVVELVKPSLKSFLFNLPMGCGKTEIVSIFVKKVNAELWRLFTEHKATFTKKEGNKLKFSDYSMFASVVSHRVSLVKGGAERFEVKDYQEIEYKRDYKGNFATCVDSIYQFETNPLLVVDEVKQTLEHLVTSDTVGSGTKVGRRGIFESFVRHVESAIISVFMDADLNDDTVTFIKKHGTGRELILFECRAKPHHAKHTILTNGHDEARLQVLELLKQGKRGTLGATSEKQALRTYKFLKDKGFRLLILTAENKGSHRQKAFLQNPTK